MHCNDMSSVQFRPLSGRRKPRPFTCYEQSRPFTCFGQYANVLEQRAGAASNSAFTSNQEKSFKLCDMPPRQMDRKFVSFNNLASLKNSVTNVNNASTPSSKRTLSIRRPKSLQMLADELKPLLEAASSLSSIGSYNELTEESVVDSSDDSRNKDRNNVVLRKGGKLRSLKHRPRSSALLERNLGSIPENILAHNLRKRHNIHAQSLHNISNSNTNGLEHILMDIEIEDKNKNDRPTDSDKKRQCERANKISEKSVSLQNIAIPRRKSRAHQMSEAVSTTSISEQSFSKEQRKRLKKKMRDTKKSPENSVFLGLF